MPALLVLVAPLAVHLLLRVGLGKKPAVQPGVSVHKHRASGLPVYLVAMGITLLAALLVADDAALAAGAILGCWLLALARIDWRYLILPDSLTLSLAGLGLVAMAYLNPDMLVWQLAGAVAGYVLFRVVAFAYRRLRGRNGLGQGDAKLMAAAGAWVGMQGLPSVILIGAMAGLLYAVVARLRGIPAAYDRRLPFGAFLCLGIWVTWVYGPILIAV